MTARIVPVVSQSFCLIDSINAVPLIWKQRIQLRDGGIRKSDHDIVEPLTEIDVIQIPQFFLRPDLWHGVRSHKGIFYIIIFGAWCYFKTEKNEGKKHASKAAGLQTV